MRPASQDQPRSVSREIDDVTLARAIRGERPALHLVVQHHQSLVWSYLWRMLRPGADEAVVQDLFQETFLGMHRALPRFSPTGPARLSTWILAIATRVALNHLRQQRRDHPADAATVNADPSDGGAGVAGMERKALGAALARAMAALTSDHRAIVLLREYHGLDYEEIARALDIDVGTVASRLNRARETLRRSLQDQPGDDGDRP
jgi:RNA polymerase sigma-70 factor (ECF subfamily)